MTPDPTACAPGPQRAPLDPDGDCAGDLKISPTADELEAFLAEQGLEAPDAVSTINYARIVTIAAHTLARVLDDKHALLRTGHAQLVAAQLGATLAELAEATRRLGQWLLAAGAEGGCDPDRAAQAAIELGRVAKGMTTVGERARRLAFPADRLPAMTPEVVAGQVHQALTARGLAFGAPLVSPTRVVWPLRDYLVLVVDSDTERPSGPWQLRHGGVDGLLVPLPLPRVTYVHPEVVADRVAAVLDGLSATAPPRAPESAQPSERAVLWPAG